MIGMNAQDMIELNNKKRELLTPENEVAYSDMLVYLRLSNVPEQQVEELLLEILDHLIEAQTENKISLQYKNTPLSLILIFRKKDKMKENKEQENNKELPILIGVNDAKKILRLR